jgi:predicted RecB family nuclease
MRKDQKAWNELQFEIPVQWEEGQVALVGAIDRVIYDSPQNLWKIVDFKLSSKPKSLESLKESYQIQLELYRSALEILEPRAKGQIELWIVNINPEAVVEWRMESDSHFELIPMVIKSQELLNQSTEAQAIVSAYCMHCPLSRSCQEYGAKKKI